MKRGLFWFGVLVLIVGAVLYFLAGATSPKITGIYGTNQTYWMIVGAVGLLFALIGLFSRRRRQ